MSLPLLDAMQPAVAAATNTAVPRRMIAIQTNRGILSQNFFPAEGRNELQADAVS